MCILCEIKHIMIAGPTTVPGFIIGKENDQYYNRSRTFIKQSKIKQYLQKRHPREITEEKRTYTLKEILKLIELTVEKEKLYHENNPEIITGDEEFETAFGTRLMMTKDVHHLVIRQMRKNTTLNKSEDGPDLSRYTTLPPRFLPKWATEQATAVKAAREADIAMVMDEDLKVSKKLGELMNIQNGYKEPRETFNLSEIMDTLFKCLKNKDMAQRMKMNNSAAIITDRTLQDALGVTALDVRQLASLAQYQTERKPCKNDRSTAKRILRLLNLAVIDNSEDDKDTEELKETIVEEEQLESLDFEEVHEAIKRL